MATAYSEIFDLFLVSIQDYTLDALYIASTPNFETYLTGFLIKAIPNFQNCEQDLEDRDDTAKTFNITLNTDEKVILSNLMRVEWLEKTVNDIRQMNNFLSDTDFRMYSNANNLKEKKELLNNAREIVTKLVTQYLNKNFDYTLLE